jgi:hypothetical protein
MVRRITVMGTDITDLTGGTAITTGTTVAGSTAAGFTAADITVIGIIDRLLLPEGLRTLAFTSIGED